MTREDFYAEVLRKLAVLAAEEAPSASDRLAAKSKYEQVHAEYSRRIIITWFDDEDIPDEFADPMATIVASRMANEYSVDPQRRLELKADAQTALTTIIADGQRREVPSENPEYY